MCRVPSEGEGVHERVALSVEVHRGHVEALAQLDIEGRRRLHPSPVEVDAAVPVVHEQVRATHDGP
jgi:hypothetical protein